MTNPIAFLDTETLGLDPDNHAVWEVGLVLHDPDTGTVVGEHLWQIALTDEQIAAGDPVGMEIGRFSERYDAANAVAPESFCATLVALTSGCHLAGNVVSFDEERLRRLCLLHGVKPGWHYHLIDVENMVVGYLHGYKEAVDVEAESASFTLPPCAASLPWKSNDLSREMGVDPDSFDRHTALADAEWARQTYLAITNHGS